MLFLLGPKTILHQRVNSFTADRQGAVKPFFSIQTVSVRFPMAMQLSRGVKTPTRSSEIRTSQLILVAIFLISAGTCKAFGILSSLVVLFTAGAAAFLLDVYSKTWSSEHTFKSAAYQYALHKSMRLMGTIASSKLEKESKQADTIQETLLMDLVNKEKNTKVGKALHLEEIHSICDFRSKIPFTRPEFYTPFVQDIIKNETNVMTSESVTLLAATSGTSGQKSLIPHVSAVLKTFFIYGVAVLFDRMFSRSFLDADQLQKTAKLIFLPRWQHTEGEGPHQTTNSTDLPTYKPRAFVPIDKSCF